MARKRSTTKGFNKSILKMDETHLQARLTRTGAGKHDSRPNRQRTRSAAKRAALRDW